MQGKIFHQKQESKSVYTGGYTPTPIALLKSVEKAKGELGQKKKSKTIECQNIKNDVTEVKSKKKETNGNEKDKGENNERKGFTSFETSEAHDEQNQRCSKKRFDESLSIEDLFETDMPSAKRSRNNDNVRVNSHAVVEDEKHGGIGIKMKKKRVTLKSKDDKSAVRFRASTRKIRTSTLAAQLMNRYEKLQKEKDELLKNFKLREEGVKVKTISAEKELDLPPTMAVTVNKGKKRVAHVPKVSKINKVALNLLDPYSCGKVPFALRHRYLNLFHIECEKFCSPSDAVTQVLFFQ
ncbi:unnamed protein product [Thelazia callipaeda]|uniref:PAPA-1 domain-containing protein n=1 Tax=Thelazia callipaeda TaxID=103827 RepID=A0A0N5CSR7_THECL|nr:unnamed protein product [Thelazia callipaeda]